MRIVLHTIFVVLLMSSWSAHAVMYKWLDEDGRVHFGDRIPIKYQLKEHDEVNQHGIVVKHKDAAKTKAEKEEAKRLAKEQKKLELMAKKEKQRDRVLLDTYTTERDLIVARSSRLDAVGSQIQLAETIISDSSTTIEALKKQVVQIKASNRKVPAEIYQRIESENQQVAVQTKVKEGHIKRRDDIVAQFGGYIERFNTLKALQKARKELLAKERDELY